MIAAPSSGSGKTVVTCGIIKLLQDKGFFVQSFKCGPDYIDPMFHRKVLNVPSYNVDTFFTGEELTKALFAEKVSEVSDCKQSVSVVEGVMGFYDGLAGKELTASSSDVARVLGLPVVLVVDAKGMSRSIVALLKGFLSCDSSHSIKAVILNKVSAMTFQLLKEMIETETGLCVLGYVPFSEECEWKSRHLGLVLPDEIEGIQTSISSFAKTISSTIDVEKLLELSRSAEDLEAEELDAFVSCPPVSEEKIEVAVARDEAFCFYYEDNIRLLQKLGAEIKYFSPLHDVEIPSCEGIILGGGYPELYGKELEDNIFMRHSLRTAVRDRHVPVLAECGGFMYLHESIKDKNGKIFKMSGTIDGQAYYTDKLVRFGYAEFSCSNMKIKGHEFHYFDSTNNGSDYVAQKPFSKRNWQCVIQANSLTAGFPHFYYYSNPAFAEDFLIKCKKWRDSFNSGKSCSQNNPSAFFENKECQYHPCHAGLKECNCLFCYCPLYARNPCPGNPTYIHKDDGRIIKRCTDCTFPHKKENYSRIMKLLKISAGVVDVKEYHHGGEISDEHIIDFSVNINPLGIPDSVRQVFEQNSKLCQTYPDQQCTELIYAIAEKRNVCNADLAKDMVIAGNGASELISLAVRSIAPKTALLCAPGFSGYERALKNCNVDINFHYLQEEEGFALTETFFNELQKMPDIVFLCNPNNPTGLCMNATLLNNIAEYCEQNDIFLIIDECFLFLCDDWKERSFMAKCTDFPHVLVIDAFTKSYAMAGLRLGFAVSSNASLICKMRQFQSEWSVSSIAQACGMEAIRNDEYIENARNMIKSERSYLSSELRKFGFSVTEGQANFILVKSQMPLYDKLLQKKIAVRNCENFIGLEGSFIRIAVRTHDQNVILIQAIRNILNDRQQKNNI